MQRLTRKLLLAAAIVIVASVVWLWLSRRSFKFTTNYQAVVLSNNNVYIGRLEGYGTRFPVLRDVFYIKNEVDQNTKEVRSLLIKRGQEWHSPEYMVLNPSHIVLIEGVRKDSKMAELIRNAGGKP